MYKYPLGTPKLTQCFGSDWPSTPYHPHQIWCTWWSHGYVCCSAGISRHTYGGDRMGVRVGAFLEVEFGVTNICEE